MRYRNPILLIVFLLLGLLPSVGADSSFTATSWHIGDPVSGILCTNAAGQVYLKGNVHIERVDSNDARVTGRLQAAMEQAYQADGTALFNGPAYLEVGTWNTAGTLFTPSGGLWNLNHRGSVLNDGTTQYGMAGYGIGGSIDSLRMELTASRAGSDPTIPYLATGTIKAAPLDLTKVVDNFDDNNPTLADSGAGVGTLTVIEAQQRFTLRGVWNSPTVSIVGYTVFASFDAPWAIANGRTLEARSDLIELSGTRSSAVLAFYHGLAEGYGITVATNWVSIWKQSGSMAFFRADKVTLKATGTLLNLALTPVNGTLIITATVTDKNTGTVLYQNSITDTSDSDPTLTSEQLAAITGGRRWSDVGHDPKIAPWTTGTVVLLGVFKDGETSTSIAEATFDNLTTRMYEVPQVGVQQAVRLSWPDTGSNFAVEAGPTLQGPWLPFQEPGLPGHKQMSAPQEDTLKFFRLQQAP